MISFSRSLVFYLGLLPLTVFFSLVSILILPLPRPTRYRIMTGWAYTAMKWLRATCSLDWQVCGLENIPNKAGVIICKHQFAWETISLQLIFPRQSQVLKKELLHIPFFGWGLASLNPIAIDRGAGIKALKAVFKKAEERISEGWWILIFPEGTRVQVGTKGKYKQTGPAIASRLDCPLVPVAHNAGAFWPRKNIKKKSGLIQVVIGPPISTSNKTVKAITEEAEDWIEETCRTLPTS